MVFSSITFLFFFLPIILSVYFLIRKDLKNLFLLIASLFFYFWGEGKYVFIMVSYMVFNYYFGLRIGKYKELKTDAGDKKAKAVFFLSLCFNLGVFVFYKYSVFIVDNINWLARFTGHTFKSPRIHLPIGISFFTFQALSYVIDVYRTDVKAQKSFIDFSMYKALFPQLIAGPIVRYRDIAREIEKRTVTVDTFVGGMERFIVGLGKKVIIANTLASVADEAFNMPPGSLSVGVAWLGAICYGLQIYFDFSGYSDMAIGLSRIFGFHFLENFDYPYVSRSIKEFWRRWHISLSTWFRDYLYIPLGGNRVAPHRVCLNLFVVFFLCGLWHGASWTFVIWGLWHGAFLALERTRFGKFIGSSPKAVGHFYTLFVVLVGWVFFRSESLTASLHYLKAMVWITGGSGLTAVDSLNVKTAIAIVLGLAGSVPFLRSMRNVFDGIGGKFEGQRASLSLTVGVAKAVLLFSVLLVCSVLLSGDTYNPFIYFRF